MKLKFLPFTLIALLLTCISCQDEVLTDQSSYEENS